MKDIKARDATIKRIEKAGFEVDRMTYIGFKTDAGQMPWTAEDEANMPEELRDWEAFQKMQDEGVLVMGEED